MSSLLSSITQKFDQKVRNRNSVAVVAVVSVLSLPLSSGGGLRSSSSWISRSGAAVNAIRLNEINFKLLKNYFKSFHISKPLKKSHFYPLKMPARHTTAATSGRRIRVSLGNNFFWGSLKPSAVAVVVSTRARARSCVITGHLHHFTRVSKC